MGIFLWCSVLIFIRCTKTKHVLPWTFWFGVSGFSCTQQCQSWSWSQPDELRRIRDGNAGLAAFTVYILWIGITFGGSGSRRGQREGETWSKMLEKRSGNVTQRRQPLCITYGAEWCVQGTVDCQLWASLSVFQKTQIWLLFGKILLMAGSVEALCAS